MTHPSSQPAWSPTTFLGDDGVKLSGRWFVPDRPARGAVLIVPAMATPSSFYGTLASWLRDSGFAVLTFDYRGLGDSLAGRMKDVDTDLIHWAHDAREALTHLADLAGDVPITWIGHSLGGQILPFADHARLSQVITVTAGSGYWRYNSPRTRRMAPLLWKVIAPASIRLCGYYPGRRLKIIGDLPAGVMRQWSRWCADPDYVVGAEQAAAQFAEVTTPIAAFSFTDDQMLSARSIDSLHAWYTNSNVVTMRFTPGQLGVDRVGHFGFFRGQHAAVWSDVLLPYLSQRRPETDGSER